MEMKKIDGKTFFGAVDFLDRFEPEFLMDYIKTNHPKYYEKVVTRPETIPVEKYYPLGQCFQNISKDKYRYFIGFDNANSCDIAFLFVVNTETNIIHRWSDDGMKITKNKGVAHSEFVRKSDRRDDFFIPIDFKFGK